MSESKSWIKYTPYGGAGRVTGSCHHFEVTLKDGTKDYALEAGLFAGKYGRKHNTNIAHLAYKLDAAFATHAHVDHIGRFPYLYKLGYRGPIYATEPVIDLAINVLPDAGKIQEENYKYFLQKSGIRNKTILAEVGLEPLYTSKDATDTLSLFRTVERGKVVKVDECLEVTFYNAGHGLGSSSILLNFNNGEETYRVFYSGDIGQNNPILKKRVDSMKKDIDLVIMESTYADRDHTSREDDYKLYRETLAETYLNGGNSIIPAFTSGRTQELWYLSHNDMISNDDEIAQTLKKIPFYVDTFLGVSSTHVYARHPEEFKASAARAMKNPKTNPFYYPNLHFCQEQDDSKDLTMHHNNYAVFSAAGMCTAGRILYHLEKDLPNPKSAVIIPGYQAEGTLGRLLVEGAKQVKIHGEVVNVRAKIVHLTGFSAHADRNELKKWLAQFEKGTYILGLAHGEPYPQQILKDDLAKSGIIEADKVELLSYGKTYHLYKGGYDITTFSVENDEPIVKVEQYEMIKKQDICKMEDVRDAIRSVWDDPFDAHALQLLGKLEQEILAEIKKAKYQRKRQAKPNAKYRKLEN